ncbi:MAG TPA: hypothetical protein VEF89_32715 [Solirubrobacteraceae bacterium]|nr:hypothetical protein [Solirubrobacteraceae bacterium]
MRYAPRAILAGGLGFAASFVVACGGGSGLLSGDQSAALNSQADAVASAVQQGNCGAAVNASSVLNNDVLTLPVTINSTLRSNLAQAAGTIAQLAQRDCHQQTASTPSIPTTSSSTSTTSTSTPTSTSTSTTTPTTTTTSTTTTTTTSSTATTPTNTGTTSTTTGGVGLGGGTTTGGGNGNSGGTGPGNGNSGGGGG